MTQLPLRVESDSTEQTVAIGAIVANWLRDGDVVLLHGDLGAGKTVLAKGIAAALRIDAVVSSPSFALVNEYATGLLAPVTRLFHLDLFRLQDEDELASIGYEEFISPSDGATIVEWPERAGSNLPDRYLLIEFETRGANSRRLSISAEPLDAAWIARVADLADRLTQENH